ncbi:GDYXXLXY domain-containing protein [Verticiella sediminum]|uniref:GDYXXLXY domain-containing protein n=1 Tax=Verticiella sediminum TaxID=1247510 RepID=UPI001FEC8201|nr:GDYXXLXY domain-containing protein [Verticiella sediminum]
MLVVANAGIWRNEAILRTGQVVLLQLAPVDPRSLMQGDYMALRFALEAEIEAVLQRGGGGDQGREAPAPAYAVLAVDADRVATFQRLQSGAVPLLDGEVALRYEWRHGRVDVAPGAFFFEEGRGAYFAAARYGELRIAPDGRALLSGLRDADLAPL